jgi:hypothetical protein
VSSLILLSSRSRLTYFNAESMDMGRPADLSLLSERRLRMANSSPDVKALFNAPAYIYNLEALEAASSVGSSGGDDLGFGESFEGGWGYGAAGEGTGLGGDSDIDYWTPTPLVPIVRLFSPFSPTKPDFLLEGFDGTDTYPPSPRRAQAWIRLAPRSQDQRTASNADAE